MIPIDATFEFRSINKLSFQHTILQRLRYGFSLMLLILQDTVFFTKQREVVNYVLLCKNVVLFTLFLTYIYHRPLLKLK